MQGQIKSKKKQSLPEEHKAGIKKSRGYQINAN
jgi:hypothetical protein